MHRRPIHLKRTSRNDHLFIFDRVRKRHEVVYQSSSIIVDILEIAAINKSQVASGEVAPRTHHGEYAFFDKFGRFYDYAKFVALQAEKPQDDTPAQKHTAHFELLDTAADGTETAAPFAIAIDDINCIAPAINPIATLSSISRIVLHW